MKPYGIPRDPDIDALEYAPASAVRKLPGPGGKARSSWKNKASKAATRRYWKRLARRAAKLLCNYPED